jgi:prolyl oligopeptidase
MNTWSHARKMFLACLALMISMPIANAADTNSADASSKAAFDYPQPRRGEQVDDYHGTKVADPYRWLEDVDSEETVAWVKAENKLTNSFLDKIPARETIRKRLTALWDYPKYGIPAMRGDRYFFTKNDGLQNQAVLYWSTGLEGEPKVLLDPNTLSADGTTALTDAEVSDDGSLLAYGLAKAGSDWQEFRVREVATGTDLPDELKWIKSSGASWTPDNKGFYYSRYDEPKEATKYLDANYYHKLFYHKLGTPQSDDKLIYERKDEKEWAFNGNVTEDGEFLIISVRKGTEPKNAIFYKRLDKPDAPIVELLKDFDARYSFVENDGNVFWIRTELDAPRGRIVAIDVEKPERANWKVVVPQSDDVLGGADVIADKFFLSYLHDAHSLIKIYDTHGKFERDLALPGIGSASISGRRRDKIAFYSFTSFTAQPTIYRYDPASAKSTLYRQPKVDFDSANYETKQVFYTSKDGTRIPMFISSKRGLKLDGNNPTLLYGYGGFNISLTPAFSVVNLAWMEMGGVYAVPNLRGGGEYGREWHDAGIKLKKQNVFDDFIAAAQYLTDNKYTSTPKLAISGRSNGGLLVGACLTQRPDLFGATLPGVGVMDMLRFHKFTVGWGWVSDYGSADNTEDFPALRAYSPLHNIKPGTKYPPTLITTADHDDRVVPGHSFKFAATLQAAQAGPAPVLIRIETQAGHGAGKPTTKLIDDAADQLAFLVKTLDMHSP